ncbi:hypothetical protein [Priestia aryabhattai]|uniref:hypothetical protein n=1 Tax=Priestia aryabhattai TaxID=412384 RepID=UPI0015F41BA1|nr:hypothetical protein [Priestia aryabhattai]
MPRWRHRVGIKKHLLDNLSNDKVKLIAETLLKQLKPIYKKEVILYKCDPVKAVKYKILSDLEDVISNLEWIIECIDNKEDMEDFSFNNWSDALKSELEQLKKIGKETTKCEQVFYQNEQFLYLK